jgi:hypothetical protein
MAKMTRRQEMEELRRENQGLLERLQDYQDRFDAIQDELPSGGDLDDEE